MMRERPIDVARRIVRKAFDRVHRARLAERSRRIREELRFDRLEGRVVLSHLSPIHHHPAVVIHADGAQPSAAKPPAKGKPNLQPPWIDTGALLRGLVGGVPVIPGGPIPILPPVKKAPAPAKPAPAKPAPKPVAAAPVNAYPSPDPAPITAMSVFISAKPPAHPFVPAKAPVVHQPAAVTKPAQKSPMDLTVPIQSLQGPPSAYPAPSPKPFLP